jgi:hypothetical protein
VQTGGILMGTNIKLNSSSGQITFYQGGSSLLGGIGMVEGSSSEDSPTGNLGI